MIRGADALRDATATVIAQATQHVVLYTPAAEPASLNSETVCRALVQLCTHSDRTRFRLLIDDTDNLLRYCERFVQTCRRLSDSVELRRTGEDHVGARDAWLIADDHIVLHRADIERAEAMLESGSRAAAGAYQRRFDKAWPHSEPIALFTLGL